MVAEWSRLARMSPSDIEGYVDGTFSDELNYEGDDGGEISVEVSELSSDKKAKKSKKVVEVEAQEENKEDERHANFMKGVNAERLNVSPQLEAVVGKGPMPRMVAMTKLWDYIKKNNLSDIQVPSKINASEKDQHYTLRLLDVVGRIVMTDARFATDGQNLVVVKVNGLASGIYSLQLQMKGDSEAVRIFVE